jgi:hypothetical protein
MAKHEFLENLRLARNLFTSPRLMVDDPSLDPQAWERLLFRRAIWLTPRSVAGFDVDDFKELGPDRQQELADAVREFLDVAGQVPPTAMPTNDQYTRGAAAMRKLLEFLGLYVGISEEEERFREAVRNLELPDWVVNWSYRFDTGGPLSRGRRCRSHARRGRLPGLGRRAGRSRGRHLPRGAALSRDSPAMR